MPPKTLNKAALMAVCYSSAWEAKIVTSAYSGSTITRSAIIIDSPSLYTSLPLYPRQPLLVRTSLLVAL